MTADYGSPDGLHIEPGAPEPVITLPPPSPLQLLVTAVAAGGATAVGTVGTWIVMVDGHSALFAAVVAVASLIGLTDVVKFGVRVRAPGMATSFEQRMLEEERKRVHRMLQNGHISGELAVSMLATLKDDAPAAATIRSVVRSVVQPRPVTLTCDGCGASGDWSASDDGRGLFCPVCLTRTASPNPGQ